MSSMEDGEHQKLLQTLFWLAWDALKVPDGAQILDFIFWFLMVLRNGKLIRGSGEKYLTVTSSPTDYKAYVLNTLKK